MILPNYDTWRLSNGETAKETRFNSWLSQITHVEEDDLRYKYIESIGVSDLDRLTEDGFYSWLFNYWEGSHVL